jgi:hypothetical protein
VIGGRVEIPGPGGVVMIIKSNKPEGSSRRASLSNIFFSSSVAFLGFDAVAG